MHNVLYILYDGLTDPLGQSQVLPYLKGLTEHGFHFTIISCDKKSRFTQFKEEIQKEIDGYSIDWHPLVYHKSPPVVSTLYDIRNLTRKAHELHADRKFKVVHCRSYISALVGLMMKKQLGVKFIFDMRGFWADERIDGGIWDLKNPVFRFIYNYFKKKERQFLSKADYTISLTEAAKEIIHQWSDVKDQPIPIQVIPCCVDMSRFSKGKLDSQKQQQFKVDHNIDDDDFIISYLGSIGTWYMLDEMLDFFSVLLKRKGNAKFLFLTNEPASMILNKAKEKNLPAEQFVIQKAAFSDVPHLISISDVSLFFIKPAFSKKASSPTKHAELMSLGIPVVCNTNVGDMDGIINKTQTGLLIDRFSSAAYEAAIDKLDDLLNIEPDHIRAEASRIYSLKEGTKKYLDVYQSLVNNEVAETS